jgi:hypothetical protein
MLEYCRAEAMRYILPGDGATASPTCSIRFYDDGMVSFDIAGASKSKLSCSLDEGWFDLDGPVRKCSFE